jgi:hypothetical protein
VSSKEFDWAVMVGCYYHFLQTGRVVLAVNLGQKEEKLHRF